MMKEKEKRAKLYERVGGLDEYGQEKEDMEFLAEITGSLLEYERRINHVTPVYDEVTKVFVTSFKGISDNCFLEIDGNVHPVKHVPDGMRKRVVYLG